MESMEALSGISVLDCSLRDGGYYTDWDFSDSLVTTYLDSVSRLPIDAVEIGYASTLEPGYFGKYRYLTPRTTSWAKDRLAPHQDLALMLDEKSVERADAARLLAGHDGIVDLVRIAVAPARIGRAARLAELLRDSGFRVGLNVMYLSTYWHDLRALTDLEEAAEYAEAVSLVDSFGACTPDQVFQAIQSVGELLPDTRIGFHGHDNLGLAFANSLSAAGAGAHVIDGTVTGIGRGPGNTKTEALMVAADSSRTGRVDYEALQQGIEAFSELQNEHQWGTNLAYMISGASGLPQNEVMSWLGKNRYSVTAIVQALHGDRSCNVDDTEYESLEYASPRETEVLVIGGGTSVAQHIDAIAEYANATNATVIHANYRHLGYIDRFTVDQYICVAGESVARLPSADLMGNITGLIVPAGPRFRGSTPAGKTPIRQVRPFNSDAGGEQLGPVPDTGPLSLALGAAVGVSARCVTLVGFDGYRSANLAQQELASEMQSLLQSFISAYPGVPLSSATRTLYAVPQTSIYGKGAEIP